MIAEPEIVTMLMTAIAALAGVIAILFGWLRAEITRAAERADARERAHTAELEALRQELADCRADKAELWARIAVLEESAGLPTSGRRRNPGGQDHDHRDQ
jgi:hypothetical protein